MRQLLIICCLALSLSSLTVAAQDIGEVLDLEWVDLLNQTDLEAMLNQPELSHEGYGWEDQLQGSDSSEAYLNSLESVEVNPEIIDKRVMIPGFIVPTVYDADRRVTEFFLVPFFGACIHLPPPPPNQIIYVTYEPGVPLKNFYDAYVVHGLLTSDIVRNDTATSAYRIHAEDVSLYSY